MCVCIMYIVHNNNIISVRTFSPVRNKRQIRPGRFCITVHCVIHYNKYARDIIIYIIII